MARRLAPDATLHGFLLHGRATPTPRQLAEVGVRAETLREVTAAEFLAAQRASADGAPYDLLVLACVGGAVQAMLHGLARVWRGVARRSVVVTGYVGVVYEKLADGLLLRHGADLVLANSSRDVARFRAVYEGVGADAAAVVPSALPFLAGRRHHPAAARGDRPYRVVFAVQPSVPAGRAERRYLLRRAAQHARRHPDREVVVKLRSRPGEHTTHLEEVPYQRLAEERDFDAPANLRLAYGNMGALLDDTDLLVTVSSTAALESLYRGIPTAVLTDLGVREALGNHYFLGSGCLCSWDDLDAGRLPRPDPDWLAAEGVLPPTDAADPADAAEVAHAPARARLAELLARRDEHGLPPLTPYYTAATAPGYLPGVLARHGLDPTGEPLPERRAPRRSGRLGGAVRRLVRRAARAVYRGGVHRVAPLVRRWGQL